MFKMTSLHQLLDHTKVKRSRGWTVNKLVMFFYSTSYAYALVSESVVGLGEGVDTDKTQIRVIVNRCRLETQHYCILLCFPKVQL